MARVVREFGKAICTLAEPADQEYTSWENWRQDYVNKAGWLRLLVSEKKCPGALFVFFSEGKEKQGAWRLKTTCGQLTQEENKIVFVTRNTRYEFQVLNEMMTQLSSCFQQFLFVREAWLFGSRAYGVPHENGDIDICVVVDDGTFTNENYGKVKLDLSRAIEFSLDIDLVMVEHHRFWELSSRKDLVYYDIFCKGYRYYSRK